MRRNKKRRNRRTPETVESSLRIEFGSILVDRWLDAARQKADGVKDLAAWLLGCAKHERAGTSPTYGDGVPSCGQVRVRISRF